MKTLIWGRQIGIFNIRSSFSNATMSFYFPIRGLFKLLPIFPCHIIILIIIVLNLLLCGNLNSVLLTKSFFCFYKFHILYWVLITIYFTCGFAKVILSGDVELNPDQNLIQFKTSQYGTGTWTAFLRTTFSKISLLSAYIFLHKFDIICLSETYLDSGILPQDLNIEMQAYTLIREDHPSNVKRGRVCVYYKNHLPLKLLNINYLEEYITFELSIKNQLCIIVILYRSPSLLPA